MRLFPFLRRGKRESNQRTGNFGKEQQLCLAIGRPQKVLAGTCPADHMQTFVGPKCCDLFVSWQLHTEAFCPRLETLMASDGLPNHLVVKAAD